ncbi:MAG: GTP cyclohydrolase I, partial [Vulcanococcus sp.]
MTSTLPSSLPGQLTPVSRRIRERLAAAGVPFLANDNIAEHLLEGEMDQLELEVAGKVRELLRSLVIDIENDHNTEETAERVARMYLHEVFKGRYHQQPKIASFPNVKQLDEIYTVG